MIAQKFAEFAARYEMLPEGTRVLCACSGGADSVCLLHLLRSMDGIGVVCAHFNHGLRGAESDRDEAFVKELCDRLGVPCVTGHGDVRGYAAERGLGIEEAARELRYAFLERTAKEQGCSRIATAHNAEDNAETVLLNLIRGTGGRGLGGIPPVRGKLIRPLLTVTRAEIETYLAEHGLPHVEDSSNASDDYTRNRIRHRILPLLREENPAAVENIGAAAELARQDEEYLSGEAERFLAAFGQTEPLPMEDFLALPRPIGARVLRLRCPGAQKKHVEAVYALCAAPAGRRETDVPGARVVLEQGKLYFNPPEPQNLPRREVRIGGITPIPEIGRYLVCRPAAETEEIHNSFNTFYFKSESICGRIYAASRGGGDSVRLLGRGCTKSLKKLFAEAGMTAAQRTETPVLYDEVGVIAVPGFGIAERCAPEKGKPVLCIELKETEMAERFTSWQEK